jgi:hypothetical protein
MSAPKYEARLKKLIATSRFKKKVVKKTGPAADFSQSFAR